MLHFTGISVACFLFLILILHIYTIDRRRFIEAPETIVSILRCLGETLTVHVVCTIWDKQFRLALIAASLPVDYKFESSEFFSTKSHMNVCLQVSLIIPLMVKLFLENSNEITVPINLCYHQNQKTTVTGQLWSELLYSLTTFCNNCDQHSTIPNELPIVEQIAVLHRLGLFSLTLLSASLVARIFVLKHLICFGCGKVHWISVAKDHCCFTFLHFLHILFPIYTERLIFSSTSPVLQITRVDHSIHTMRLWAASKAKSLCIDWYMELFFKVVQNDVNQCLEQIKTLRLPDLVAADQCEVEIQVNVTLRAKLVSEVKVNVCKLKVSNHSTITLVFVHIPEKCGYYLQKFVRKAFCNTINASQNPFISSSLIANASMCLRLYVKC